MWGRLLGGVGPRFRGGDGCERRGRRVLGLFVGPLWVSGWLVVSGGTHRYPFRCWLCGWRSGLAGGWPWGDAPGFARLRHAAAPREGLAAVRRGLWPSNGTRSLTGRGRRRAGVRPSGDATGAPRILVPHKTVMPHHRQAEKLNVAATCGAHLRRSNFTREVTGSWVVQIPRSRRASVANQMGPTALCDCMTMAR